MTLEEEELRNSNIELTVENLAFQRIIKDAIKYVEECDYLSQDVLLKILNGEDDDEDNN